VTAAAVIIDVLNWRFIAHVTFSPKSKASLRFFLQFIAQKEEQNT
jgi:hypothetical protein